ncbi:MAG: hypothetical protein LBJ12_00925 [Oscillospiraceae bacterium]|nr:hypothetical protein [Oscillospiraceae bacterium]
MGEAFKRFLGFISQWFENYDVHGVANPFVQLIQGLINAIGGWFGGN